MRATHTIPALLLAGALALPLAGCGVDVDALLAPGATTENSVLSGNGIVVIAPGDSGQAIARKLQEAGVTRADHFSFLAQRDPEAVYVQPGTYRLDTNISAENALEQLVSGQYKDPGLVIPEGLTAVEVYALVADRLRVPEQEVELAAKKLEKKLGMLEGFLFPATYDIDGLTPEDALQAMYERFDQDYAERLENRAAEAGLTLNEAVTLASILQVEVAPRDYAKAARVIYNRLKAGRPLQLDSTINYATGKKTVKPTASDISVDSPYNTYRYPGLPPGPISNPGDAALRAALKPADGEWKYWVTVNLDTQQTKFAVSEEEFFKYKREFDAWLAAQ